MATVAPPKACYAVSAILGELILVEVVVLARLSIQLHRFVLLRQYQCSLVHTYTLSCLLLILH